MIDLFVCFGLFPFISFVFVCFVVQYTCIHNVVGSIIALGYCYEESLKCSYLLQLQRPSSS